MKNYTYLLVLVILLPVTTLSQNSIGIRTGVSLSSWKIEQSGISQTMDRISEITVGVPLEFRLSNLFSLQPELNIISKGGKLSGYGNLMGVSFSYEQIIKINYIEFPLLGKFSFRSGSVLMELFLGPSLGYGLDGYTKTVATVNGQTESDKSSINFKEDSIARTDFGFNLGFDLSFPVGMNRIFFDVRDQFGLTNLAGPANAGATDPIKVHDNTIQITAGIYFPLTPKSPGVSGLKERKREGK